MYHDSLEEVEQVKSEYEAKLISLNDNYASTKAENEVLKERVDILFKLGKSYLERSTNHEEVNNVVEDNEIEVIEDPSNENEDGPLKSWSTNKLRGFKRVGPAATAETVKPKPVPVISAKKTPVDLVKAVTALDTTRGSNKNNISPPPTIDLPVSETMPKRDTRTRYCHYFSNWGRCDYEEKTGNKCKFEHGAAPMCNNGINCSRSKCMYSHPNPNSSFLMKGRGFNPILQPWQVMNPWIKPPTTPMMKNHWNWMANQNSQ